jgi:hypothetical protein
MALTVSLDSGLMGNPSFEEAAARNLQFYVGRITGTYGGAFTTMTVPINQAFFVSIPPASTYAFQYNGASTVFAILVQGPSVSNSTLATCPTSIDMSSFTMLWNGTVTTGVPFIAVGW